MITLASIEEIEEILLKTRQYIKEKKITLIPRIENRKTLYKLGISYDDAYAMIEEMTYENYSQGPSSERDTRFDPGDVWIFGIKIEDAEIEELYVKLKFVGEKDQMICLSFHEAKYPIIYPYQNVKDRGENE